MSDTTATVATITDENPLAPILERTEKAVAQLRAEKAAKEKLAKPDFGSGRYSAVMAEFYADLGRLTKLHPAVCEKAARQLGVDLGRLMASQPVAIKYGNVTKEGKMSLAEAARLKGVTATYVLSLAKEVAAANEINARRACRVMAIEPQGEVANWLDELALAD
jgi:hypothetical protein